MAGTKVSPRAVTRRGRGRELEEGGAEGGEDVKTTSGGGAMVGGV